MQVKAANLYFYGLKLKVLMSRNVIIAVILLLAGSVIIFRSFSSDITTYATFGLASGGSRVKVVGTLAKDKPMVYDPEKAHDLFTFYMKDNDGNVRQVVLHKPKPQDFEMSEQIVVTGKLKGEVFDAEEILMKCPSKYKNEEIAVKDRKG